MRKVALAPDAAPKLVGQMIGNALAAVTVSPKGYVEGEGLEEALARTSFLLEQDDLKGALKELEGLNGYSQKVTHYVLTCHSLYASLPLTMYLPVTHYSFLRIGNAPRLVV